jgi:hypothetical protein
MNKELFLVLDTETANDLDNPLVYDLGFAVCDRYGKIYMKKSFVIGDIFLHNAKIMQTAYYASKIPQYIEDIASGKMQIIDIVSAKRYVAKIIKKYNIKAVCAYNASFDVRSLNTTLRYVTKSKMRWFFPYGTEIRCIWNMACQVLYTQSNFYKFAEMNGFISKSRNFQTSAEIGYRYITKNETFTEEHRGLQDVEIEILIMAKCYAQKKHMEKNVNRRCWAIPTNYFVECFGEKP